MDIVISYDGVTVEGAVIPKPSSMSSVSWMEFWENVDRLPEILCDLDDLYAKVESLEALRED